MFRLPRNECRAVFGWVVVLGCSGGGATMSLPDGAIDVYDGGSRPPDDADAAGGAAASEVGVGGSGGDGGAGGTGGVDALGVSFAKDVFPIVVRSCAIVGCHDTPTQQNHWSNFSTTASTYQRWVNGPGFDFCDMSEPFVTRTIVVPGDPEASFLVMKITSTRQEPCRDNHYPRMPPPQFPSLAPAEIETIASWIREGAQDN